MPFLSVELHDVDLTRGDRRVLHGINWRIGPGQRWALLGHNGAGKTQLLKVLSGDVWPTPSARGRRIYRQRLESQSEPQGIKEQIAYVGAERQDKYARHGWNLTVRELVTTGLFGTDLALDEPRPAERRRVTAMLQRLGLERLASRRMLTLSYGEQRLALIARALVSRPRLLLLDEVFNGLDAVRRESLMRFLVRSRRARLPWVLAIHREEDLPSSATHVLVLERGRIRYRGPRRRAPLREFFDPSRREGPLPALRPRARTRQSATRRRRAGPLIEILHADVHVEHHRVLTDLRWTLRAGEHWAILGRNGSGKSSLVKLLYGDLSPAHGGTVERAGFPAGTPIEEFKKTVGLLSSELQSDHARDDLTVEDIVISGRHASIGLNERPRPADVLAARRWLDHLGLRALAPRRPRELSYGQMRRVLLARAMVNDPRWLFLDEPCTGLDVATRAVVLAHLEHLARDGVQIVMATHHASDLIPAINRILELRRGTATVRARSARRGDAARS